MDPQGRGAAQRWFFPLFGVYVLVAVALLVVGLVAVAIDASAGLRETVRGWDGWVAAGLLDAAGQTHGGLRTVADYSFSVVNIVLGLVVLWLRPDNWTARMIAVGAIGTAAAFNLESHTVFFAFSEQGAPAGAVNAAHMSLHAISGAAYLHAFLAFPDGRLSAGWPRNLVRVVWAVAAVETVGAFASTSGNGPLSGAMSAALRAISGEGFYVLDRDVLAALTSGDALLFIVFFGLFVPAVGVVAQADRYRRASTPDERQQTRVLTWALVGAFGLGTVFVVVAVVVGVGSPDPHVFFHQVEGVMFRVFAPLFTIIPAALLVGVLRYRLWSVDRVVSRIVLYGVLTLGLGLAYIVVVAGFGLALRPVAPGLAGDLALVLATLAIAALFRPVHRRLQTSIDRRFRRYRPDPAASVGDLEERLRGREDLDDLRTEVLGTAEAMFEPAHLSAWVLGEDEVERGSGP